MSSFYISAAHKSSGKTTLSVGLAAAFARRGHKVRCFKKGPDYIDPLWLAKASGHACYNLDFNTQNHTEIASLFYGKKLGHDLSFVEGNKGLFDGMDLEGADSNAAMAHLLKLPVVLVLDCQGTTRGIAPLLKGYVDFAPELTFAGVILNKVASSRHESKLRAVIKHYTDLEIMGAMPAQKALLSPERHLGLIPPAEAGRADETIGWLADLVEQYIDLDRLVEVTQNAPSSAVALAESPLTAPDLYRGVRIAVLRDAAFGFYYADDLEAFEKAGAELVFVDALCATCLPPCDGLFIGGGFPETHLEQLEAGAALRADILAKGQAGLPIYAECGGLMYLSRQIGWQGRTAQMVGLVPGDVTMHSRPQGRGLVKVALTDQALWSVRAGEGAVNRSSSAEEELLVNAHEFHYARLENLPADSRFAFEMKRGAGITGTHDGLLIYNLQANFTHIRHTRAYPWVSAFLAFVKEVKKTGKFL